MANNIFDQGEMQDAANSLREISNIVSQLRDKYDDLGNDASSSIGRLLRYIRQMQNEFKPRNIREAANALEDFGDNADEAQRTLEDFVREVGALSKNSTQAKKVLREFGISGEYVNGILLKTSKSMQNLNRVANFLNGNFAKMTTVFGSMGGALEQLAIHTKDYSKEVYNGVRASNAFGYSSKSALNGLKQMGDVVGLNTKAASVFYQTWIKSSAAMIPSTKEMTDVVKALGDEFGNTEEDINNSLQTLGSLEKMKIGIDTKFITDLKNGLVSSAEYAEKIAKIQIMNPAGARETAMWLERIRTSDTRDEETKGLKILSDLMAHLRAQADAFVNANGEKLKDLIAGMVKVLTMLLNIASKIPAPILKMVVLFTMLKGMSSQISQNFAFMASMAGRIGGSLGRLGGLRRIFGGALPRVSLSGGGPIDFKKMVEASFEVFNRGVYSLGNAAINSSKSLWTFARNLGSGSFWRGLFTRRGRASMPGIGGFSPSARAIRSMESSFGGGGYAAGRGASFGGRFALPTWSGIKVGFSNVGTQLLRLKDGFKILRGTIARVIGIYGPLIAVVGSVVAAFLAASAVLNKYHDKKTGQSAQAKALRGYDEVYKLQLQGKTGEASRKRDQINKQYEGASGRSAESIGRGGTAGLAAGATVGGVMLALGAIPVAGWAAAAALGAVTGAIVGFMRVTEESAKVTTKKYASDLNEFMLREKGHRLTKAEIDANEKLVESIRAAKFGTGRWAKVKEWFATEMPAWVTVMSTTFKAIKAVFNFLLLKPITFVFKKLFSTFVWFEEGLSKAVVGILSFLGLIKGPSKGPFDEEVQLAKRNMQLGKQMSDIQTQIEAKNEQIITAYAKGNIEAAKEEEWQRFRLRAKYEEKAIEKRRNELLISDPTIKNIEDETERRKKATEQARLEVEQGEKQKDLVTYIASQMTRVTAEYESQKTQITLALNAHKAIFEILQKEGASAGAGKALANAQVQANELWKASKHAAEEMDRYGKSLRGLSVEEGDKKVAESIEETQAKIKELTQKGGEDSEAQLVVLEAKLETLKKMVGSSDKDNMISQLKSKFLQEQNMALETQNDLVSKIGEGHRRNIDLLRSRQQLGQAELDMVKSFMGGIGLTYEMQVQQLDRVRASADEVGKVIDEKQSGLNALRDQEKVLTKQINTIRAAGGDTKEAEENLAHLNALMITAEMALNSAKQERVNLVKEELELTKELRQGYLSAMQSQALAAGQFSKIIFTRQQHVSTMLDNMRSSEEKARAERDRLDVGAQAYNLELGGRLNEEMARGVQGAFAAGGPSRMTTEGFKNNFGAKGGASDLVATFGGIKLAQITQEQMFPDAAAAANANRAIAGAHAAVALTPANKSVISGQALTQNMGAALANPIIDMQNAAAHLEEVNSRQEALRQIGIGVPAPLEGRASEFGRNFNPEEQYKKLSDAVSEGAKKGVKEGMSNPDLDFGAGTIPGFASGGPIGYSSSRDSIPYRGSNGDFVIRRSESKDPLKSKIINALQNKTGIMMTRGEKIIGRGKYGKDQLGLLYALNNPKISGEEIAKSMTGDGFGGKINNNTSTSHVNVGGINLAYNYDSSMSPQQNNDQLLGAVVNQVQKELKEAMAKKHKARMGV